MGRDKRTGKMGRKQEKEGSDRRGGGRGNLALISKLAPMSSNIMNNSVKLQSYNKSVTTGTNKYTST